MYDDERHNSSRARRCKHSRFRQRPPPNRSKNNPKYSSMQYIDILKQLAFWADPEAVKGMARYGIDSSSAYGVSIPKLRSLAKQVGKDHELAQKLWA